MMSKRIISFLLTLIMLVGMIPPVNVWAEETEEIIAATEVPAAAGTEASTEGIRETTEAIPDSTGETVPSQEEETLGIAAEAAGAVIRTGTLDGDFDWTMTDDGTLTISGSGIVTVKSTDWPFITQNGFS